jgi:negative regulator of replication initiation
MKISGRMAACALGLALIASLQARAEGPEAQPPDLKRTDPAPAALRQADALIEKYAQPVAEQEPTPQQKQAIQSAMKLLKSEQAMKEQSAIERFVEIGPATLGELRRLAATAPAENSTGGNPAADAYPATLAAIIIQRIETAQRGPILEELLSLGDDARAVLSRKLYENEAAANAAESDIEAATAALVKASVNTTLDSPAVATERKALAEAQAKEEQVQARYELLLELWRLLEPRPPVQPQPPPEEQPAIPPADVLDIQPISPPMGMGPFDDESQAPYFFGGGFDGGSAVNRYSHRGAESRGAAHRGGGEGGRGKR